MFVELVYELTPYNKVGTTEFLFYLTHIAGQFLFIYIYVHIHGL